MIGILLLAGGLLGLVGWVWVMVSAFGESVPWGVGVLLCGPAGWCTACCTGKN